MNRIGAGWKNSTARYGRIAMIVHWSIATLFVALYASVYYRHWFTAEGTATNITAIQLHFSFGISVATLVAFRIAYRLTARWPEEVEGPRYQQLLASSVHLCLYAVMVVMPLTGYLGTKADTDFFGLFIIPKFADTALFDLLVAKGLGLSFEQFEAPLDVIHHFLGKAVVCLLVLGHAGAALYHHAVLKDDVLRRMLPTSSLPN